MEEDQAHAYYVDLKNKGSGAAMFKEGLGFEKGGPGMMSQGHTQFVAQKQDSQENEQDTQTAPQQDQSGNPHPWQSTTPLHSQQQQQVSHVQQHVRQDLAQQQQPGWGLNGTPQQSPRPPAAAPHRPGLGPGSLPPGGRGAPGPHFAGQRPAGPSGPMPGPPPRGPVNAWSGVHIGASPPSNQPLMMGPAGRGMPPRGPPNGSLGMPPGMMGRGLPPGVHSRPPPGMQHPGMMQGFPGGGPPPGFPLQRPPLSTSQRPPPPQGWPHSQQGLPRPHPVMPHPMHRPPPQHPGGGPPQMHQQRPAPPQPGSHMRPMPPQHQLPQQLPPQQQQQHLQQPSGGVPSPRPGGMASPGPQAVQQARLPVPTHLNGRPATPSAQPAHQQQPGVGSQAALAPGKPTTAGWMAHKSADGQVYYHNTSTGESSWQKPAGFEGDAAAGQGAPTPVSSDPIPLTGWAEVTCTDGRKYYYHAERGETSWSKPPEVAAALAKAIKAGSSKKAGMTADQVAIIARLKANNAQLNLRPELQEAEEAEEDNDDVTFSNQDIGRPDGAALPPPPQNPPLPTSLPPMPGAPPRPGYFPVGYPGQAAPQLPPLPAPRSHDALVQDFKDLLLETKVTPFSRWERELPKLMGDSRYKAIDKPKERRQIFDDFCRNVAEEQARSKERKEQQAAAAEAAFLALLDEAQAGQQEDEEAAELGGSDADVGEGEGEARPSEKPYNDLREIRAALTASSQTDQMEAAWGHDPRWQGIDSKLREKLLVARIDELQADVKQAEEASKAAKEQAFRALLEEKQVSSSSRWSEVKREVRSEGRYKAIRSADREAAFKHYQAHLKEGEEVKRRQEQETLDREAAGKKAEADAKRRQRDAAHNDAVAAFQTLLAETVKDPSARWQDWRAKLGKDPQGRADNKAFAPREQQSLFEKYVKDLALHIEQDFRSAMDQVLRPLLPPEPQARVRPAPLATFQAAATLLEADPRWDRVADRDRERLWREYVRDIVHERDYPQQRNRTAASSRAAERDRGRSAKDVGDVVDKAYLREYIEPEQKRLRRE